MVFWTDWVGAIESSRKLLSDWSIRLLFLFCLSLSVVGFLRPLSAINQPFGGFIWLRDHVWGFSVSWEVGRGWIGRQAGLRLEDHILRIQGQEIPLDGEPDVIGDVYRRAKVEDLVDYEVERMIAGKKEILHVQVPVTRFTWRYLFESYAPFFAASLAVWLIGFFVHRACPESTVSNVFALMCLALSVALSVHSFTGSIHKYFGSYWLTSVIHTPGWPMLNALGIHFWSIFPEPRAWWPRIRPWVYGIAVVIVGVRSWAFTPWGDARLINPMIIPITVFSVVSCLYAVVVSVWSYRRSRLPWVRQAVKMIGVGQSLGWAIPFLSMALYILFRPSYDVWWSPARLFQTSLASDFPLPLPFQLLIMAVVVPAFTAVAILRYGALSAKPAAVKAVTATVLLGSLIMAYTVLVGGLQKLFDLLNLDVLAFRLVGEHLNWMWVSNVLATLVTATLFTPLHDRIQQGITLLLYPYRIPLDEALRRLHEAMRQAGQDPETDDGNRVLWVVVETLREMLHLQDVYLWLYFPVTGDLQSAGRTDVGPARVPLDESTLRALIEARPPFDPSADLALEPLSVALEGLNIQRCLPLVYQGRELVGLVGLGPRRDQVPFSLEDCHLLFHLTEYLLLLLKNVRTVRALQQSRERISRAQEIERKRVAHDLHDQTLTDLSCLATVRLEQCKRAVSNPQEAVRLIEEAQEEVGRVSAELRGILSDISPEVVSGRGLVSALESLVSGIMRRQSGEQVEIALHVKGYINQMLPEQYELAVFRYVQEALRNALQHAQAGRVDIRLQCMDGLLEAVVEDDGRGFDVDQLGEALRSGHLGMQNMQDRIETVGGKFVVNSTPGMGVTVQAVIPWPVDEQRSEYSASSRS